ncbi:unnamed protein product [Leuciscus chuanchicus]
MEEVASRAAPVGGGGVPPDRTFQITLLLVCRPVGISNLTLICSPTGVLNYAALHWSSWAANVAKWRMFFLSKNKHTLEVELQRELEKVPKHANQTWGPSPESTSKKTLPPINNCNSSCARGVYKGDSTI